MLKRKKRKRKIDTSIEGYRYIGVNLTEEQFKDLCMINIMMLGETDTPVHYIVLILKILGLLPPELICEIGNNETTGNTEGINNDEFQKRFGRVKD